MLVYAPAALVGAALALLGSSAASAAHKCAACHHVADHVASRLAATEKRANDPVYVGSRPVDTDGGAASAKIVRYGDSERRLMDVLEGACTGSADRARCTQVLHEKDDAIADWFYERRDKTAFVDDVCGACEMPSEAVPSSEGASAGHAHAGHVDVHDEPVAAPAEPKAAEAPKKQAKSAPKHNAQETPRSEEASMDPAAIVGKVFGRMRNNLRRIRALGAELGGEILYAARTRDTSRLRAVIRDPNFVRKYWLLFLAIFTVVYTIVSTLAPLFSAPKKRRGTSARATRRPRATSAEARDDSPATPRKTRASSRAKAASGSTAD